MYRDIIINIEKQLEHEISYKQISVILLEHNSLWNKAVKHDVEKTIRNYCNSEMNLVLASLILYLIYEKDEALVFARKRGLFAYYNQWIGTGYILEWLNKNIDSIDISDCEKSFIKHKFELMWLYNFYKDNDNKIDTFISDYEKNKKIITYNGIEFVSNIVIDLLVYVELLFRYKDTLNDNKFVSIECLKHVDYNMIHNYSLEEIGEGISFVISRYYNNYDDTGIKLFVDTDVFNTNELSDIVLLAVKRKKIIEWEVDIDYYGYDIEVSKDNSIVTYNIIDTNNYEKSINLGYIKNDIQNSTKAYYSLDMAKNILSLYSFYEDMRDYSVLLYELVDKDTELERFRMIFYEPLIDSVSPLNYETEFFFGEELLEIHNAAYEMLVSDEDLLNLHITELCTIKDVVFFKRFFILISYLQQLLLEENKDKENLVYRSLVPVFSRKKLLELIKKFVSADKARELLELFCWNKNDFLDLQSTPIIKINEDNYFILPYLLASSNLIRNGIVYRRKLKNQITNSDGNNEPLEMFAKKLFDNYKDIFSHVENCNFTYKNSNGEVDLVVWSDKHLYLIECKNSILPTSSFELRTTYDYIKKAEKQLDLSCSALQDELTKNNILKNWGIPIKDYSIHTLIILGNRIFTSPNGFNHQIRYIYELNMILNGGEINSSYGKWRYWENEVFSEDDFIRFISNKDAIENNYIQSLCPYKKSLTYEKYKIQRESYYLEIEKFYELNDKNLVNLSTHENILLREEFVKNHNDIKKQIIKDLNISKDIN